MKFLLIRHIQTLLDYEESRDRFKFLGREVRNIMTKGTILQSHRYGINKLSMQIDDGTGVIPLTLWENNAAFANKDLDLRIGMIIVVKINVRMYRQ
jgi:hypothetical protein